MGALKEVNSFYRVFHRLIGQDKFLDGGLILGLSQFTQLPQLPLKMALDLSKVKIDNHLALFI